MPSKLLESELTRVTNVVTHFLDTGVCVIDNDWHARRGKPELTPPVSLRNFTRSVAKENKRPFISAEKRGNDPKNIELKIPKVSKLKLLTSGLFLCATPVQRVYHVGKEGVFLVESKSLWFFVFRNANEVFDMWLEQVKTDRVMRIALNLPQK